MAKPGQSFKARLVGFCKKKRKTHGIEEEFLRAMIVRTDGSFREVDAEEIWFIDEPFTEDFEVE